MQDDQQKVTTKQSKKRRRKKRYFLRLLVFCAIVAGCILFLNSNFFLVAKIEVTGNEYYSRAQVVEISGMTGGYNIFKTDTKEPLAKLLADPYISLATIKKKPRNTILIDITERTEYAAVPYGNEYIIIDETGMVLRSTEVEPILPLLEGMNIIERTPGKALSVEQSYLLTGTLELLHAMYENEIYFKKVHFSNAVVICYVYDDLCCKGTPEQITQNMDNLSVLLQKLYNEGTNKGVIMVGSDDHLTYSPKLE